MISLNLPDECVSTKLRVAVNHDCVFSFSNPILIIIIIIIITRCFAWLKVGLYALHMPSQACMNCMSSCCTYEALHKQGEDANFNRRRSPMQVTWEGS